MGRKPKTPEDLALKRTGKKSYAVYLDVSLMETVKARAAEAGTSASEVVNEAIAFYMSYIKPHSSKKNQR